MTMANVIESRKTTGTEVGELLLRADITRPTQGRKTTRILLFVTPHLQEGVYLVVGGCRAGLDLFSVGEKVSKKPISPPGGLYTHFIASCE